jgi:hypothetical protein
VSPKNKGKFGKGKTTVEVEDEFVSGANRLLQRLKPYTKQLVIGGVVILIAVFAAVGYNMYKKRQAARATELFDQAVVLYQQPVMSAEEAELIKGLNLPNTPVDFVTHPSVQARAETTLVVLEELSSKYGSTGVAERARLFHAGVLYDAGKYDEAAALYREFAKSDAPADQRIVAREGVGYALEAKALAAVDATARQQGLEKALEAFKKVQSKDDGIYRDYALYHQGRVLQSLERKNEAVALYNQVLETLPTTPLRGEISKRLAVLEKPANEDK